jgi:hypothetical protein
VASLHFRQLASDFLFHVPGWGMHPGNNPVDIRSQSLWRLMPFHLFIYCGLLNQKDTPDMAGSLAGATVDTSPS